MKISHSALDPRPRLSAFWFFFMAALGIFFPYYSLYLGRELALSSTRVGMVLAIIPLVGIATQPLWGQLADRTGSRRLVLVLVTAGTAIAWGALAWPRSFVGALLGTAALACFSTSVLPMAAATSMAALRDREIGEGAAGFGRVRMWGTLGFLAAVVVFPRALEHAARAEAETTAPWRGLGLVFPCAAVVCLVAAGLTTRLPRSPALSLRAHRGDVRVLLRHAPLARLLGVVFLAHLFMMGPIGLFPLFVTARGGDVASIGRMWIFMLLLEVPLIGLSRHTLRKLGARGLLTVGLLAEGARWTISALSTDLGWIQAVQLLHGVGVAGVLVGAPLYVEQAVPERLRATGQALSSVAGAGAGAVLSNLAAGLLFDHLGPGATYGAAGLGALVLGLSLHRWLPRPRRPAEADPRPDDIAIP